jgi:hypothetical protein
MTYGMDGILHFKATITTIEVTRKTIVSVTIPNNLSEELFIFKVLGEKRFTSKNLVNYIAPFTIEFYENVEAGERLFDAIMNESLLHHVQDESLSIEKLIIQSSLDTDNHDRRTQKVLVYGHARHSILNEDLLPYDIEFFADEPFCTILRHILEANIGYDFSRYPYARPDNSST